MGAPKTCDGRPRIAFEKSAGTRITICTFRWTDRTSWYQQAERVVDEVATDSGNHIVYTLAHANAIDSYHAKIFGEDYLVDANGYSYRMVVKEDGAAKTEQDPHYGTGGDYTVNYATSTITFLAARSPTAVITVTYHYENGSQFIIKPPPGKVLYADATELNFSDDIEMNDTTVFQPYGIVDNVAPQLTPTPYAPGTLIPLGNPSKYKCMDDFLVESVGTFPMYPALGGTGWRGMKRPATSMRWDYLLSTAISPALVAEIRLSLEHNAAYGGASGTATFYCRSENIG